MEVLILIIIYLYFSTRARCLGAVKLLKFSQLSGFVGYVKIWQGCAKTECVNVKRGYQNWRILPNSRYPSVLVGGNCLTLID